MQKKKLENVFQYYPDTNTHVNSKTPDRFEEWKEYDENNNMIHYKNSSSKHWNIKIEK